MNSRERIERAINFQRMDRIPRCDDYLDEFISAWRDSKKLAPSIRIEDCYGIDLAVCVSNETLFPSQQEVIKEDSRIVLRRDGWGRILEEQRGVELYKIVEQEVKEKKQIDELKPDSASLESRYLEFDESIKRNDKAQRAIWVKIGGPYIRSTFLWGQERLLMDMVTDESFCQVLFGKVGDHLLNIAREEISRAGSAYLGVAIYDDMASNNGPMFSPDTFGQLLLPVYQKIIEALRKEGVSRFFFHSDGNILPLMELLMEAGICGINPVEPRVGMEVPALLKRFSHQMTYFGGVCNTRILPSGDKKRIEQHVRPIIEVAREGGVVIGSGSIGPDISLETYDYYIQLLDKYGKYN